MRDYEWAINHIFQGLLDARPVTHPKKVGIPEFDFLWNEYLMGTNKYKMHLLKLSRLFLKWAGNIEIERVPTGAPRETLGG